MSFSRHHNFGAPRAKTGQQTDAQAPQSPARFDLPARRRKPIGQILVDMGAVSVRDLARAAAMRDYQDARIGDILLAHGMVSEVQLYRALAIQHGATVADLESTPADVRLIDTYGAKNCLRDGLLPWRRVGGMVVIASCRPEEFDARRAELIDMFGPVRLAVTSETALHEAVLRSRRRRLAENAETRVAAHESCREMDVRKATRVVSALGLAFVLLAALAPVAVAVAFTAWAVITLTVSMGLKLAAVFAQKRRVREDLALFSSRRKKPPMPIVSILVPLFKEREIASRLVKRLTRLNYPRELLDICLVVEEDDTVTQAAIARTDLPRWIRQIVVPRGGVKTKPRALNYALDFCRGSIVAIYDAEDAPAPQQIHDVAARFAVAGPEVACLQGILDFYNAKTNWLSRCFTVEYATWWRVVLPGYEKLGLVVPLGGTTLFMRRSALEELGGWDAHNVTEDADLGLRLARHGYRTELIHTVTEEEANCRVWPWVKQRSRWLKGYAMTYAVHMRRPRQLWRDLGPWRFFGVQALFLGALSQFALAPFLWSFWAFPLGLPHPLGNLIPYELFLVLGALFIFSEAITVAVSMVATSNPKHKWLWPWVPTLHFYYPLATLAALKGLIEIVTKPFYWDKTAHGIHDVPDAHAAAAEDRSAPLTLAQSQRSDMPKLVLGKEDALRAALPPRLDETQTVGFAETRTDYKHRRAELDEILGKNLPRPVRGLTFGIDLTGGPICRQVHNAEPALASPLDPDRLRPAPRPAAEARGASATTNLRPGYPALMLGAEAHRQKTGQTAGNTNGSPDWAHTAAFAPRPAFLPEVPPDTAAAQEEITAPSRPASQQMENA